MKINSFLIILALLISQFSLFSCTESYENMGKVDPKLVDKTEIDSSRTKSVYRFSELSSVLAESGELFGENCLPIQKVSFEHTDGNLNVVNDQHEVTIVYKTQDRVQAVSAWVDRADENNIRSLQITDKFPKLKTHFSNTIQQLKGKSADDLKACENSNAALNSALSHMGVLIQTHSEIQEGFLEVAVTAGEDSKHWNILFSSDRAQKTFRMNKVAESSWTGELDSWQVDGISKLAKVYAGAHIECHRGGNGDPGHVEVGPLKEGGLRNLYVQEKFVSDRQCDTFNDHVLCAFTHESVTKKVKIPMEATWSGRFRMIWIYSDSVHSHYTGLNCVVRPLDLIGQATN
jgi:hypothetical protein